MINEVLNPSRDFESWKTELLRYGRIMQDGEEAENESSAEEDFHRYVALVDVVDGSEEVDVCAALFRSVQVEDDYGAYESTLGAALRFPATIYAKAFVRELPDLIVRQPDRAGDFLSVLANNLSGERDRIDAINREIGNCSPAARAVILEFIRQEEESGWLDRGKQGIYGK